MTKYESVYHRAWIKENHPSTYVILCVDLGLTKEVEKTEVQFKHLLNYFAALPCIAIACRLAGIEFQLDNYQMPLKTYIELYALCQGGPFYIQPCNQLSNVLDVQVFTIDKTCLNTIIVEKGLAVCILYVLYID